MDNLNDTFVKCYEYLSPRFHDKCFDTDILLINADAYAYLDLNDLACKYYMADFYICMLCAGVDENIYLRSPKNRSFIYGCDNGYKPFGQHLFDSFAAIYCGEYDLADNIIDISDDQICSRLVKDECWDYIDRITDCGKNKKHTDIIMRLLINYLKGDDSIFKYIARYNKNDSMTDDTALNIALLKINNVSEIFWEISHEANIIKIDEFSVVDEKAFNIRSIALMERCAKLGMTLEKFVSFKKMLIPIYSEENISCIDDTHQIHDEYIKLPGILAKLIDKNTIVYCQNKGLPETTDELLDGSQISFFRIVEFEDYTHNFLAYVDELEYICIDFKERYGKRLVITARNANELCGMKYMPKELFEIKLSSGILEGFYDKINNLKKVLNCGLLSQKNIDEITAYFASKVNSSDSSNSSFAIKRLRQLGDKLTKMKDKEKGKR